MERINRILQNKYFQEYLQNIYKWEINRKFCRHDFEHSLAVARIAYLISLERGNNFPRDILYGAALLHDIGRWQEYEGGIDHAQASAELAEGILEEAGYGEKEKIVITRAIREHRGKGINNMSLLGEFIFEADKFSRLCWQCQVRDECYKYKEMPARGGLCY